MFSEGFGFNELVHTVEGQVSGDGGTQVWGGGHTHSVRTHNLHT